MATLAQLFGAFVVTFLLSREAVKLLGRWYSGPQLLGAAHGSTLMLAWIVTAFGTAEAGAPRWSAGAIFLLPSLIWFLIGLSRMHEEAKIEESGIYPPSETHIIRKGRDIAG